MEEPPSVTGRMISGQACISDKSMMHELEARGYGEMQGNKMFLKQFEVLYLLYTGRLKLGKNLSTFDSFLHRCQSDDPGILTKFLIYRDLRNRGYIVKDGFGFGSDFRVYERGHFGQKGAKFLVFGLDEGQKEKMGAMQKKIQEIIQMGKEPIMAVIERRGEVIYYKINRMNFYENV
ncbi:MAG: tRNA-intron lyase [Nitrosopumilus sp. B06]|nr:MAG: tRNA-intron lyase [Nitrosopumilus sp. D6]RNJ80189.1 MAG: tRNA-intron lyase [Nitrosopumilus sp. B06]